MDMLEELEELENLFSYRYTEEDADYMENVSTPLAAPPCVENWYVRPKRQWDRSRGNDRGRGRGRGRGRYDNYRGGGNRDYQYRGNNDQQRNADHSRQFDRNTHRDYYTDRPNRGYNQNENYNQGRDDSQGRRGGYDRREGGNRHHGQERDRYYGDRHQPYRGRGRGGGTRDWQ